MVCLIDGTCGQREASNDRIHQGLLMPIKQHTTVSLSLDVTGSLLVLYVHAYNNPA